MTPESVEGCADGWAVPGRWARRKQAPKTRRASKVVTLTTRRNREGFVVRVAERRSPNAGQNGSYAVRLSEEGDTEVWGKLKNTG